MAWWNPLDWGTGSAGTDMLPATIARAQEIQGRLDAGQFVSDADRTFLRAYVQVYGLPANGASVQAESDRAGSTLTYLGAEIEEQAGRLVQGTKDALTFTGNSILWPLAIIAVAAIIIIYLPRGGK